MPTFNEIETKLDQYMLLEDRGIFRLLMAFMIARKLPLEPAFLFIVSASSGGKTKLLQLFSKIAGYTELDDLTKNTFLSGMKKSDKETSFLSTLNANSFLLFKDWTTILSKYKDEMGALMGQLRVIYDGAMHKRTGSGDKLAWTGKVGLLAGVTTTMYMHQKDMADMGERMLYYHMTQPDNMKLGKWIMRKERRERNEKELENHLQDMIVEFEASIVIPLEGVDLPDFDDETIESLIEIAFLATGARSAIQRKEFDRNERMLMKHDREQIGRFLKQLSVFAYGLALLNEDKKLTDQDKAILFRIGLDSIPLQRKWVLDALTERKLGGSAAQLADYLHYPVDSVKMWVEDLVALGLVDIQNIYFKGGASKTYKINQEYAHIIAKFAHITPTEEKLPDSEEEKQQESAFTANNITL